MLIRCLCIVLLFSSFFAMSARSQRQTAEYLDDGNGSFLKLIVSSLSASRTVTFPDPGADANVILSTSSAGQTIAGGLTVSGGLTSGAFTLPTAKGNSGEAITSDGTGGSSWQSPSGFTPQLLFVYNTGTQFVVTGSRIIFNTSGYASGLSYSTSTGIVTVNAAGTYEIEYTVRSSTANGTISIMQNGVTVSGTTISWGTANTFTTFSALVQCSSADIIEVRNTGGSTFTITSSLITQTDASLTMKRVQ